MRNDSTMTRLREANPVRALDEGDADELFASIIAGPGDQRLVAQHPTRRRALTIAVVAGLMALLATAFTTYRELYSAPAVDPEVTKQEYERAIHQLTLPPGASWPAFNMPPNSVTSQGGGGGQAVAISQHEWECYWVDAIRSGNAVGQMRAHTELQSLLDNNIFEAPVGASESWAPQPTPKAPFMVYANDGGLEWVSDGYAMAAAGHPQRLIQTCTANGG